MLDRKPYTIEYLPPVTGTDKKLSVRSARELRRREFPAIRYVVPGYIAEGCTLLAGRPKLGKSWLVLDMGLAVATGSTCLGAIECEQGDVLYLALEDNERRLQRRIDKVLGALHEWPESFQYATEWPRANDGGVEEIENWILAARSPRLVVVDVLAMFRPTSSRSDNPYETDYLAVKGLQGLASRYNVAIVIVHHTRKSGSEVDSFEKVSGTLGLSGGADTTIVLDRDGNGATLYGRGRDVEEIESAVEFDRETCRWQVQGAASEVRRSDERSLLLELLYEAKEPMSPTDLADQTGKRTPAVRKLLHSMMKADQVQKTKRGRYIHPERTDLVTEDDPLTPGNIGNKITSVNASYRAARDGDDGD